MAHHQRHNQGRLTVAVQGLSSGSGPHGSTNMSTAGDDDLASDVDEPPDNHIHFTKLATPSSLRSSSDWGYITSPQLSHYKKESLLTQGLLSSPELNPTSDVEAPVLASDGGLPSPARTTTPSPPLPTMNHRGLATLVSKLSKEAALSRNENTLNPVPSAQKIEVDRSEEGKVEEGLGRRRCIRFACGRQSTTTNKVESLAHDQETVEQPQKPADPPKRPCMLRFACPTKPQRDDTPVVQPAQKPGGCIAETPATIDRLADEIPTTSSSREHRSSTSTVKISPTRVVRSESVVVPQPGKPQNFNRVDFQKSEATRFHEFAGAFTAEDEWINEQTAHRQKITVNDTLRKENAIRRLAEEVEAEALDEDDVQVEIEDDVDELDDDDEEEEEEEAEASDGGNETDDEEGFADSDDESDGNSEYQFWTPGLTTAATSTDQVDHIHPLKDRVDSESSVESAIDTKHRVPIKHRKGSRTHRSPRMRPGTPELPDSSDFVVGTLDEDRPLEEAYMSCLEERRRSRHRLIPQDIDPSFPTSEPDEDNDDDDDGNATQTDHEPEWVMGRPDSSEEEDLIDGRKASSSTVASKSSVPSPKRMHSPPPKRSIVHRSPPPRRLFGQATHRLRSPPPTHRKLTSPPSSRRPSLTGSPHNKTQGIRMPHLAQRPNLTHTTSLPRTPNPFWDQHRRSRFHVSETPSAGTSPRTVRPSRMDIHSRGPIDIVQGLETKRQRRKDKFWRQHCRQAAKEKERRCQPGKGAQRMRELGLEMADRCRGYGQRQQLVLSI